MLANLLVIVKTDHKKTISKSNTENFKLEWDKIEIQPIQPCTSRTLEDKTTFHMLQQSSEQSPDDQSLKN